MGTQGKSTLRTYPSGRVPTEIVHDVAKLVGFAQFYSKFIPQFKLRIAPLRNLITMFEYTDPIKSHWTTAAQDFIEDIKQAILLDPCLMQFNHQQLIVLCTDFSSCGFGYVLCQPENNEASTAAINAYQSGTDFSFMTKSSRAALHPVVFGTQRCRGIKVCLHSHLGKGFSGDYAMNKCRHYLFGQRFVWVTNCYATKFILSYDSANHAILCLQMRLMKWDVDIVHKNTSRMRTTGLALALTCALTHYSRPILTSHGCYASKTLPQPCSQ